MRERFRQLATNAVAMTTIATAIATCATEANRGTPLAYHASIERIAIVRGPSSNQGTNVEPRTTAENRRPPMQRQRVP